MSKSRKLLSMLPGIGMTLFILLLFAPVISELI